LKLQYLPIVTNRFHSWDRPSPDILLRVLRLAGAAALLGCFSDRPATEPDMPVPGTTVNITNFKFVPPNLSVATGTTVTFTNSDNVQHTVSSDQSNGFDSGAFSQGMTFQLTAGPPGTYGYFCRIHPFMKGTLTVTP
jgi:plastocyanin